MMWRYEKNISVPSDKIKIKIAVELGESVENIFFGPNVV
jgi:DNA-binding XRE family transcriptional regulator